MMSATDRDALRLLPMVEPMEINMSSEQQRHRRRRKRQGHRAVGHSRAITLREPDSCTSDVDLDWIKENFNEIHDLAQYGYQSWGRGVVWIDLTERPPRARYIDQRGASKRFGGPPGPRIVAEYDPEQEIVIATYKGHQTYNLCRVTLTQSQAED